jgi:hypothetical protein
MNKGASLIVNEILDSSIQKEISMYIIKVKGKAKIPDYIQLRDDNFVLVAYFRVDRELKNLEKYGLAGQNEKLLAIIKELPFGKLQKLEF